MAHLKQESYKPIPENQQVYEKLFAEYLRLHDYFGRGENNVMKTLKKIRAEVKHVA
jgi:L-ribulokinase